MEQLFLKLNKQNNRKVLHQAAWNLFQILQLTKFHNKIKEKKKKNYVRN